MNNHNIYILLLIFISSGHFSKAQTDSTLHKSPRHLFGFGFGFTTTKLSGNELNFMLNSPPVSGKNSHQQSKAGFNLDFIYQYMLAKNYFVKSGLSIVSKKNEFQRDPAFPFHSYLTYIAVPAVAGIDLGGSKTGKLSVLIETGFVGNLVASSDHITEHWTETVTTHIKTFVPSYTAGASFSFKAKNEYRFFAAWRLTKDLTNVYERVHDYENTDGDRVVKRYNYRTASNHFTIGLFLPAKSKL